MVCAHSPVLTEQRIGHHEVERVIFECEPSVALCRGKGKGNQQ